MLQPDFLMKRNFPSYLYVACMAYVLFSFLEVFRNPYEKYGLVLSVCYSIIFAWGVIKLININAKVTGLLIFFFLTIFFLRELLFPFISPDFNSCVSMPIVLVSININYETTVYWYFLFASIQSGIQTTRPARAITSRDVVSRELWTAQPLVRPFRPLLAKF